MKIIALLPDDRSKLGSLSLYNDDGDTLAGPLACDGQSDLSAAIEAGNPSRNPTKAFGNTPLGEYKGSISHVPDSPQDRRSYGIPDETGAIPTIDLAAAPGDTEAWKARTNGRTGLKIHSGDLNGYGHLRETHGCIRLLEVDMGHLLTAIDGARTFPVSVRSSEPESEPAIAA
jgi:hypothetical protein